MYFEGDIEVFSKEKFCKKNRAWGGIKENPPFIEFINPFLFSKKLDNKKIHIILYEKINTL